MSIRHQHTSEIQQRDITMDLCRQFLFRQLADKHLLLVWTYSGMLPLIYTFFGVETSLIMTILSFRMKAKSIKRFHYISLMLAAMLNFILYGRNVPSYTTVLWRQWTTAGYHFVPRISRSFAAHLSVKEVKGFWAYFWII